MGIEQIVTSARSPWQNPFVERLIGSIRRECLDHTIVFNERHVRRVLTEYFRYYHDSRRISDWPRIARNPDPWSHRSSGSSKRSRWSAGSIIDTFDALLDTEPHLPGRLLGFEGPTSPHHPFFSTLIGLDVDHGSLSSRRGRW